MNSNKLMKELRKVPGNIRSPKLPGGTLVSAVLDRRLMAWSDRGGASRILGEIWSEHCWHFLSNGSNVFGEAASLESETTVLRLDDHPQIAVQAGRQQLPNPDFLLLHRNETGQFTVRAVDAKFAVERLRRTQISPESIRDLVEMPGSLVNQAIEARFGDGVSENLVYASGAFLGPRTLLNTFHYEWLTSSDEPRIPPAELLLLPIGPEELFSGIEEMPLMQLMSAVDTLTADSPEGELVLSMYYLRLAGAARWFTTQSRIPLLSDQTPEPVDIGEVYEEAQQRIEPGENAYGLIENWHASTEKFVKQQKLVKDAARFPVRMSEIRKLLEYRGLGEEKKLIRRVRGSLEKAFTRMLIDKTGEIPAQPSEPISIIVERVRDASRSLRDDMLQEAEATVDQIGDEERIESPSS